MRVALVVGSGVFLAVSLAESRTWQIEAGGSGDAATVQAGIDSAAVGDTVLVGPGRYSEVIDFSGKDILVGSASGAGQTFLDGSGIPAPVVSIQSGESRSAVLEGLTIVGGSRGGILICESQPTIRENRVVGNSATAGAGILCTSLEETLGHWSPLIQDNDIVSNTAQYNGAGIGVWEHMTPEILDNVIAYNNALSGDGGGMDLRGITGDDETIIRGNRIENNSAGDHGGGIYILHFGDGTRALDISNNVISGNTTRGEDGLSGGGIFMSRVDAWVHHNTLVNNEGRGVDSTWGGGIVVSMPSAPVIEQNIIALSRDGGGIRCGNGATPIIRNNLAWNNSPTDGVGDCPGWWTSDGNLVADPLFCNLAMGDPSVAQNSPAMTHPAGPLGALPLPGCGPVAVVPTTWGRIKALYVFEP